MKTNNRSKKINVFFSLETKFKTQYKITSM